MLLEQLDKESQPTGGPTENCNKTKKGSRDDLRPKTS